MSAIREVEELADIFRDNYFKTVFDFLKFTTTFIVAYQVWLFSSFSAFEIHVVGFAAFCAITSGLFGLKTIISILTFYNAGLTTRRLHETSLRGYFPEHATEGMIRSSREASASIRHLSEREKYLSKIIPIWVSIHVSLILLSVTAFAILFLGLCGSIILLAAIVVISPILLRMANRYDEIKTVYSRVKSGIVGFFRHD